MPRAIAIQRPERALPFADFAPKAGEKFTHPAALSDEEKLGLIQEIRAGQVLELRVPVRVFGDRPNANLIRPRPGRLAEIAKDTSGLPFLRDHWLFTTRSKFGHIDRSTIKPAKDSVDELIDVLVITRPEEQEAFIRGEINDFSISYQYDAAFCSKCNEQAGHGWFGPLLKCDCGIGSRFRDADTGKHRIVEIFTEGNRRLETSWVNLGAYSDTKILSEFQSANQTGTAFFGIHPINNVASHRQEDTMSVQTTTDPAVQDPEAQPQDPAPATNTPNISPPAPAKTPAEKAIDVAFGVIFNAGVKSGKLIPGQRDFQRRTLDKVFGDDIEAFQSHIEGLPTVSAYAQSATGVATNAPPPKTKQGALDDLHLAKASVSLGFVKPEYYKTVFNQEPPKAPPSALRHIGR